MLIFTTKSLIYTCATGVIGIIFYYIFGALLGVTWLGIGLALLFVFIVFVVGTFKIPDNDSLEITRKAGGEYIDKAFLRWWKFKKKGNLIYTYLGTEDDTARK